ncbi:MULTISPECIES: cation-transporting P-type ATPase [unclassified Streptomyces]|uniref:cation-transporting P-type ATPase n=1 Tax=unclassified Streptomyces TaxID=2593676 RepID=UPI0027E469CD|nr:MULTISPECIES: cation-transporting P-type ATPase [unclassified Streptomyces]
MTARGFALPGRPDAVEGGIRHDHAHPRTPAGLAPPGRTRRDRKAAELESRTRLAGERLIGHSFRPRAQVLQDLGASPAGLTHAEAALRLERHGANVVADERAPRW